MHSTRTRVHARIPNGLPREEKRVSDKSPRTLSASWTGRARRGNRQGAGQGDCRVTPRLIPRKNPRAGVGEEVGVGVRVGPVEFKLKGTLKTVIGTKWTPSMRHHTKSPTFRLCVFYKHVFSLNSKPSI